MSLKLYNTLTREVTLFQPLKTGLVTMYTCGPTVYAPAHIGNLRAFVVSDWFRRVLVWNGYQVQAVINVTDVDDKTIKSSQAVALPLAIFTSQYEKNFFADLDLLKVELPNIIPHATEYIKEMVKMINILLAKDFAYQTEDGIYFRVAKAKNYGALAQFNLDSTKAQSRIKNDQYDKETPSDFALWKFWQVSDGEVGWEAPFGKGRPGWHLECSAMIRAVLGKTIDIHLGGTDLIFPHHTNEIAQSEAVTGVPLSRVWSHVAFVNMNGGKMAKSEGNVATLADITNHFSPFTSPQAGRVYRYWLLSAHYRTTINFTWEALEGAATALKKLQNHISDLHETVQHSVLDKSGTPNQEYLDKFTEAINNDLNLPVALSVIWQLLDDPASPHDESGRPALADTLATILEFDKVLGLDLISATQTLDIPDNVKQLLADREIARQKQDWQLADKLRQKINKLGFYLEDNSVGPRLRKS